MRELVLEIRLTDKQDWSIEINGRRYEQFRQKSWRNW